MMLLQELVATMKLLPCLWADIDRRNVAFEWLHISFTIVWVSFWFCWSLFGNFLGNFRFAIWGFALGNSARGMWLRITVLEIWGKEKIGNEHLMWWSGNRGRPFQNFWSGVRVAIIWSLAAMAAAKALLVSSILPKSCTRSSCWAASATFSAHKSENLSSFFHLDRAADVRFFLRLCNFFNVLTSS